MLRRTFWPTNKGVPSSIRSRVHSFDSPFSSTSSLVLSAADERRNRHIVSPIWANTLPAGGTAIALELCVDLGGTLYLALLGARVFLAGLSFRKNSDVTPFDSSSSCIGAGVGVEVGLGTAPDVKRTLPVLTPPRQNSIAITIKPIFQSL